MGTQTSKPLFGDEERRNRFRRPRTPTNIASSTASTSSSTAEGTTTTGGGDSKNNKRTTWPCANCHATVSNEESRCPYCGGIQVKVNQIPRSPLSGGATTKAINANLLLERLMTTPTTPVTRKEIDPTKIQAFLSESATTSTMDYDDEEEDDDEEVMLQHQQNQQQDNTNNNRLVVVTSDNNNNDNNSNNRPASALSQASSLSQNFNIPIQQLQQQQQHRPNIPPFDSNSPIPPPIFSDRPPDPVALTLESAQVRSGAPSPALSTQPVVIFDTCNNGETIPSPIPMISTMQQQHQQPVTNSFVVTKRKAAASCNSGFEVPKKKVASAAASVSSSSPS